jgi:hypothetical protein
MARSVGAALPTRITDAIALMSLFYQSGHIHSRQGRGHGIGGER